MFANRPVRQKFLYFDANTNIFTLLLYPLVVGLALVVLLPWLRLLGAILVKYPSKLLENLQHDSLQEYRIYELEASAKEIEVNARLEAAKEQAKIDAARRLTEAEEVGGDQLRRELSDQRSEDPLEIGFGLGHEASEILTDSANSNNSISWDETTLNGPQLLVGNRNLLLDKPKRDQASYRAALEELLRKTLIELRRKQSGIERYEVTKKGYMVADLLY